MHVRSSQEREIFQSWPKVVESYKNEAFNSLLVWTPKQVDVTELTSCH